MKLVLAVFLRSTPGMGRGIRLQLSLAVRDPGRIEALLSGGTQEVRTVVRDLALRQLDRGLSTPEVGSLVGLAGKTVREIGQRYQASGLERALFDAPRPGKVPSLDPGQRQQVVALVCSSPPEGFARWTVRLLAQEAVSRKIVPSIGREAIRMLLQRHDLRPWREKNVVRRQAR
jgi:transposase